VIVLLVLVGFALSRQATMLTWWRAASAHRLMPVAIALLTLVAFWSVRGFERDPAAVISDEASYKLQASLFAAGRWTDTVPNPRDPFRQMYVLDEPVTASKYPPGHALALAPGFRLGFPFAIPLLAAALSGALIYLLGRRLWHAEAGIVAWLSWMASSGPIEWGTTWFSEATSGVLMLAGWWLALQRPLSNRRAHALGAITGWLAITRPLTAITFVAPIAVMMLVDAWRQRTAMRIVWASVAALPILVVLPVWSWQTTGDPALTPLEMYTARHLPVDRVGFRTDTSAAPDPLADDQAQVEQFLVALHAEHTPQNYLPHLVERLRSYLVDHTPGRMELLYPFVMLGLLLLPPWLLGSFALQYLSYGFYAHALNWNLYYEELGPLAALGVAAMICFVVRRAAQRTQSAVWIMVTLVFGAMAFSQVGAARQDATDRDEGIRRFREAARLLPDGSVVFVEYAPRHNFHRALVANLAPWADQEVLVAYDRGLSANQAAAMRLRRAGYLYREVDGSIQPLSAAGTSSGSGTIPTAP
jgi:hypothetical protein